MEGEARTDRTTVADVLRDIGDLAEPLERTAILERVGRVAANSIGAELGFVGLLDGADQMKLSSVHGGTTGALDDLLVERGRGLGGKVLALGQVTSVVDYTVADTITHEYDEEIRREGLGGMLCIPLALGDDVHGVVYVAERAPMVYTDVMIDHVLTATESAKLAISMADRSKELTTAAVEVERQRTVEALDAQVGGHLGHILEIARAIAADPTSSPALIEQASSIVTTARDATSVLHGSLDLHDLVSSANDVRSPLCALSPRELEVVQLAARGLSNPEIATELFLARGTVKAYMEGVLQKLGARNRVEAVMIAARAGLLDGLTR